MFDGMTEWHSDAVLKYLEAVLLHNVIEGIFPLLKGDRYGSFNTRNRSTRKRTR